MFTEQRSAALLNLAAACMLVAGIVAQGQGPVVPKSDRLAAFRLSRPSLGQLPQSAQTQRTSTIPPQHPASNQSQEESGKQAATLLPAQISEFPSQPQPQPQPTQPPQPPQPPQPQQPLTAVATVKDRGARTADSIFKNGDGYNIFVTNTCENEAMRVNIKTSRPFFGVIHTKNQRQKPICATEANGAVEYNFDISLVLNPSDANYCGVIKAKRNSPNDKDILSVVIAVRLHPNIELSDDKFFLLNCTNRCRRPDCSPPKLAELSSDDNPPSGDAENNDSGSGSGSGSATNKAQIGDEVNECNIWKFPWLIALLWAMGISLVALMISHCVLCSSLTCRWVKSEIEEKEDSVFEASDYDHDDCHSTHNQTKPQTKPAKIDYDNKQIYKTSNNYTPYSTAKQTNNRRRHF